MSDLLNTVAIVVDAPLPTSVDATEVVGAPGVVRRFQFADSLEWMVDHRLNTTHFIERLTTIDGERFFAPVSILDPQRFVVRLTEAKSGYVDVVFNTLRS